MDWLTVCVFSEEEDRPFFHWPIFGPLIVENESSDARDHCANERSTHPVPLSLSCHSLILIHSVPLIPSVIDIHGHRLGSHHTFVPLKERSHTVRVENGKASRDDILGTLGLDSACWDG